MRYSIMFKIISVERIKILIKVEKHTSFTSDWPLWPSITKTNKQATTKNQDTKTPKPTNQTREALFEEVFIFCANISDTKI